MLMQTPLTSWRELSAGRKAHARWLLQYRYIISAHRTRLFLTCRVCVTLYNAGLVCHAKDAHLEDGLLVDQPAA